MIQFLLDTTVTGDRFPAGSISSFGTVLERQLISQGVAVLSPLPSLIAQSYIGWTRSSANSSADSVYQILTSVVLPGNTMGLNSKLIIIPDWDMTSSASTKSLSVDFGAQNISGPTVTTSVMGSILIEVKAINSLSVQKTVNGSSYGVSGNARITTTVDTTQDAAIDFKVKWSASASAETIALMGYSIWHYPGS